MKKDFVTSKERLRNLNKFIFFEKMAWIILIIIILYEVKLWL